VQGKQLYAEAAPPLQSGGRFREPGKKFGMTSPASSSIDQGSEKPSAAYV